MRKLKLNTEIQNSISDLHKLLIENKMIKKGQQVSLIMPDSTCVAPCHWVASTDEGGARIFICECPE